MKVVLVTGGAGEIGSAICKQFAANGFSVIATYNSNSTKAEKLLEELNAIRNPQSEIVNHSIFHAPTTDAQKVTDLKAFVVEKYGKLDMGKSCIRFKKVDEIPFELIGELTAKMSADEWIECYEKAFVKKKK